MKSLTSAIMLIGTLVLSILNIGWSRQIGVPGDFNSIAEAIQNAGSPDDPALGDTILVAPGRYRETLTIRKNIRLVSHYIFSLDSVDIFATTIVGDGDHSVITVIGPYSPLIAGFQILGGGGYRGAGATFTNRASAVIRNCIIRHCESGIACLSGSDAAIRDNSITDNRHPFGGDAVFINFSNPILNRNDLSANTGHGLKIENLALVTVNNCRILGNGSAGVRVWEATARLTNCDIIGNRDDAVGGVFFGRRSHGLVENCLIQENVGGDYGGLVCIESDPEINGCRIIENVGGSVGGVYCGTNSFTVFNNCEISRNESRGSWGAARFSESVPRMVGCKINNNTSQNGCAGISLYLSQAFLSRCQIYGHHSRSGGGAFQMSCSMLNLINGTVYNNSSPEAGGGFKVEGGSRLAIQNSIIWANSTPVFKLRSWGEDPTLQTSLQMKFSDVGPSEELLSTDSITIIEWDKSNFNRMPEFVDYLTPDLSLLTESPCIDSGDPYTALDPDSTLADRGAIYFPQPNLRLSRNWITWPDIRPRQTQRCTVEVRNIGVLPLFISSIEFTADEALRLESDSPRALFFIEPRSMERYQIVFSPLDNREHRGLLVVNSNDRSDPRALIFIQGKALSVSEEPGAVGGEFRLSSAYPNPFNSELTVELLLPRPGPVKMELLDIFGRQVISSQDFIGSAGLNTLALSGKNLPGGTYVLQVSQGENSVLSRVLHVK